MKQNFRLILASQSPRRADLLRSVDYSFEVMCPDESVEESANLDLAPEKLVVELAILKAQHVVERLRSDASPIATENGAIVLAADTVACCHGQILGKPTSREDAKRMLRLMSGSLHEVLTGVCIWDLNSNRHREYLEVTELRMDELIDAQLELYLETDGWRGKAGAFGYQDDLDWVHIEQGLASNVVGLPVERLASWIGEGWIEEVTEEMD